MSLHHYYMLGHAKIICLVSTNSKLFKKINLVPLKIRFVSAMNNGFTEVKYKSRAKKRSRSFSGVINVEYCTIDVPKLERKVVDRKEKLLQSKFLQAVLTSIASNIPHVHEIICYGLGNFFDCYISQTQLAALLLLKDSLNAKVLIYDPVFQPSEKTLLRKLDLDVISENEEGKRVISSDKKTLLFFPHCPKQLVNNFLWANWSSNLRNCAILSNSFSKIVETGTKQILDEVSCIRDIVKLTNEFSLPLDEEYRSMFNDIAFHTFPHQVEEVFWASRPEPVYELESIEYISDDIHVNIV